MSDDYLFDGTGEPDPDVARLEQMLGRLRSTASAPSIANVGADPRVRLPADTPVGRHTMSVRFLAPALAAAAAIVMMVGLLWQNASMTPSWDVAVIIGTPRIDAGALVGEGRIAVGQTLTTDAGSRAKMEVSDIGQVTVDEQTRVRLVETRDGHHRLALGRGTLHAAIAAPPGQFVVNTPSATATDLGCVYSLHVNDDGSGMLSVEAGWVAFEERGRESFVPSGASSRTDRVNGPGTPRYDDTEPAFRQAIDDVDNRRDVSRRAAALRFVLEHARGRDAMTLWHLIPRTVGDDRAAVVHALEARAPLPAGVSREAVLRADRNALDQWWDTLGLNQASWWRKWKQPLPSPAAPAHTARVAQIKDTVRLTVTGPGIGRPLEITDPEMVTKFSVYGSAFLAAPASEPDAAWPRYAVTFDMQTREGVKTGVYTLDYVKSRWTGDGFIYLPGRGDARYRLNIGTMMRGIQDGAWHRASDAWSAAINPHLP